VDNITADIFIVNRYSLMDSGFLFQKISKGLKFKTKKEEGVVHAF